MVSMLTNSESNSIGSRDSAEIEILKRKRKLKNIFFININLLLQPKLHVD